MSDASRDDLRDLLETRFSQIHSDLRRIQELGTQYTYLDRDIRDLRLYLEQQMTAIRKDQENQEKRLHSVETVQASREAIYQMMYRLAAYVLTGFVAALGGIVYIQSRG